MVDELGNASIEDFKWAEDPETEIECFKCKTVWKLKDSFGCPNCDGVDGGLSQFMSVSVKDFKNTIKDLETLMIGKKNKKRVGIAKINKIIERLSKTKE